MGIYYSVRDETKNREIMSGGRRLLNGLREILGWRDLLTEPYIFLDGESVAPTVNASTLLELVDAAIIDISDVDQGRLSELEVSGLIRSLENLRDYILENKECRYSVTMTE
tara:strand:+ start:182 stop:514 length:333 start_codon:yes stop_codon:yes gene_type:complete